MIPTIESLPVALITGVPAFFLALFLHELGHWAVGRLLGRPVPACGIGPVKPWFRRRIGGTQFYFGRPLTTGMTLGVQSYPDQNRWDQFWYIAGGPLASILGLAAGWLGWGFVARSDALAAFTYVSAWLTFWALIPFSLNVGTFRLSSDAAQLIDLMRGHRSALQTPLGIVLTNLDGACKLLDGLSARSGAAYYRLLHGTIALALNDVATARSSLAEAVSREPRDIPEADATSAFLAAAIAIVTEDPQAPEHIALAASRSNNSQTVQAILQLTDISQQLESGRGDASRLRQFREDYARSGQTDLLCTTDVYLFRHNPPQDLEAGLQQILAQHHHRVTPTLRAQLLANATGHFVDRGDIASARRYYLQAQAAILENAAAIASPVTKAAYLQYAGAPLERAVLTCGDDVPLFLSQPEAAAAKGNGFSQAAFGVAVGALTMAVLLVIRRPSPSTHESMTAFITVLWLLSTLAGLLSIGRKEGRPWPVAIAFAMSLVATVLAAATKPEKPRPIPPALIEMPDVENLETD